MTVSLREAVKNVPAKKQFDQMLGSNITFYHNQKWNLLQTISPFDQKHVSIAQMRLCKKATVYGPNLKYVSLT